MAKGHSKSNGSNGNGHAARQEMAKEDLAEIHFIHPIKVGTRVLHSLSERDASWNLSAQTLELQVGPPQQSLVTVDGRAPVQPKATLVPVPGYELHVVDRVARRAVKSFVPMSNIANVTRPLVLVDTRNPTTGEMEQVWMAPSDFARLKAEENADGKLHA